ESTETISRSSSEELSEQSSCVYPLVLTHRRKKSEDVTQVDFQLIGFSPKTKFSIAATSLAILTLVVPIFFSTWPTRMITETEAHQIVIW
ncbi:unnamed protein product, partial [Brassica rapa subsp. trilocularis]